MGNLGRLRQITGSERWLLLKTWLLFWIVRPSLWLLPYRASRQLCERMSRPPLGDRRDKFTPQKLAWAVEVASRYIPGGEHCLTRAHVAQILLHRRGFPSHIRFGVLQDGGDELSAHSWVECMGATVIGGGDLDRYVELVPPPDSFDRTSPGPHRLRRRR